MDEEKYAEEKYATEKRKVGRPKLPVRQCTLCDRPVHALGRCVYHYEQIYRERLKQRQCIKPRCNGHQYRVGLCRSHYRRELAALKEGPPQPPLSRYSPKPDGDLAEY